MTGGLRLDWAAASDAGRVRANNQDAAVAEATLFAVADGMGGHAAGEVASRVAVESMRTAVNDGADGLVEAVHVANRAVWERASDDPSLRGMGTTVAAIALLDDDDGETRVHVVNVGDSRVYLLRDGELEQITEDHSLVAELEREGRLTAEEARVHPQRNIVTRVLGNTPEVDVDEFPIDPFRGDRFLLCSDGLFNEVGDDEIATVLRNERDPHAAVDRLVQLANDAGGRDNITVIVVDVLDDGDRAANASAALAGSAATTTSLAEPIEPTQPAEPAEPTVATTPAPDTKAKRGRRAPTHAATTTAKRRWVTWRSVLFSLALLIVVGAIVGSVWWFARGTFYVGFDHDQVAIFRGRPGGVLWLDPTVEERTGIKQSDVEPARVADLRAGKAEPSLSAARDYARSVTTTTSTTSTTTTSTTAPAPFGVTTTSAP